MSASDLATRGDGQWWLQPENEKHDAVLGVVKHIRDNQEYRKLTDLLHCSLYTSTPVVGFGIGARRSTIASSRLTLNVVRNMVGAVTSKIAAKNKPKPTFLTEEGDYELREKAEQLEKFVSGVFYDSSVYSQVTQCFRDAAVYGTGFLKIYDGDDRVEVQRVLQRNIVVDDEEARFGQPRNLYQRDYFDRLVLKAEWAKGERADEIVAGIDRCERDPEDVEYAYRTASDQVLVTEAWHLGETNDTPGRHVVCVDGCTLLDEEWDGPFPFAMIQWSPPDEGFFGVGLAEELMPIQAEINKLLQQIQRGHHLIAGHYLVEQGSKVTTAQMNNDLATIVKYTGTPPQYQAPQVISSEVYQHLWQLYAKAFEIAGISQLNATGQKPSGLDSGAAQRAYQDIQSERFLEVGQNYEEFVVEVARQVVRCAKRIGGHYRVRAVSKNALETIKWSDVNLDEDLYVIRVYPTSMLPSTPAGKLAWAQDMIQSQVIPPEDVLDIVDFPDTAAYAKRRNAPRKVVERNISHMIRTGEFISPEPFDNHALALRLVNEAYHEARLDGVPEDRLELLRRYMADTNDLMQPPPAPPGPPPGMMPPMGGPPMPPPGPPMPGPMPGPPMMPPTPMAA